MKWEKRTDRLWVARGEKGQFAILRLNKFKYSCCYKVHFGDVVMFRFFAGSIGEAKKKCEENYHWER